MNLIRLKNGSYVHTEDRGEAFYNLPRLSITDEEGEFLAALANNCTVFEIGTGLGVSTRYLASKAIWVVTVDIDEWVADNISLPDNTTLYIEPPLFVPEVAFDLSFIDGCHNTPSALADIKRAWEYTRVGGKIAMHDANYPNVRAAIEQFGMAYEVIDTTHGIAVINRT